MIFTLYLDKFLIGSCIVTNHYCCYITQTMQDDLYQGQESLSFTEMTKHLQHVHTYLLKFLSDWNFWIRIQLKGLFRSLIISNQIYSVYMSFRFCNDLSKFQRIECLKIQSYQKHFQQLIIYEFFKRIFLDIQSRYFSCKKQPLKVKKMSNFYGAVHKKQFD